MASRMTAWTITRRSWASLMPIALLVIFTFTVLPAAAQPDTTAVEEPDSALVDPVFDDELQPEPIEVDTSATDLFDTVDPIVDDEAVADTLDAMQDTMDEAMDDAADMMQDDSLMTDPDSMMDDDSIMMDPDSLMMDGEAAMDTMMAAPDSMMIDTMGDTPMPMDAMGADTSGAVSDPFASTPTSYTSQVRIPAGSLPDPNRRFRGEDAGEGYTPGFTIDRNEVTNAEFARFLSANASHEMFFDERMYITRSESGSYSADQGWGDFPVVFVDWYGAYAYAQWAGKSLPTEEEWILAALGSFNSQDLTSYYPWGQTNPDSVDANLLDPTTIPAPAAVGSHQGSNTITGIADMAGNVAEWTLTNFVRQRTFGESDEGLRETAVIPDSLAAGSAMPDSTLRFVVKGGSFMDPAANTQLNRRSTRFPDERSQYVGFRCITREGSR